MMPHKFRPVTALLLFTGLNAILVSTITPVYDSVCFHPYWERRQSASFCSGLSLVGNKRRALVRQGT
ncbi:uncharacterized protein LOC130790109 isoform X3 [Actinidia eriantha]|uniref:uncharacterized protein LOC130790109 isoform X3 n=1 Tax=Actinidia eriantha TaxID=165200 RepID=UPI00258611F4|nr:uncharacterized protein LOC130790109 isoform X3 [Actinidia eriantha]